MKSRNESELAARGVLSAALALAAMLGSTPALADAVAKGPSGYATAQVMYAVVAADGSVVNGSNLEGVVKGDTGGYQVDMHHDVSRCMYIAAVGATTAGAPPMGFASVSPRVGFPKAVFVKTSNVAGAATNLPFHLIVSC